MIDQSHRWQKTALAAAAVALLGLSTTGAHALSLGRITVQSALGEPLRAEIDVPDINAEEASSLKAGVAAPAAFTAAGLEYNAAMSSLQVTLQRRNDGRAYLRLSGDRPINEPFVDMILEASWSSGRIVRDFTMLFDPPVVRSAPAPTLAQTTAPVVSATNTLNVARPAVPAAPAPSSTVDSAQRPIAAPKPATSAAPTPVATTKPSTPASGQTVTVKDGDYASKIAARVKPANVSLDQMLVALMRSNPNAFVNKNLNRLRSGAVLEIPGADQATSISPAEASQMVVAQSKDFNEFRRALADNAPKADVGTGDRKAGGKIEGKVEDKKPASTTPDKLTLSKGAVQAQSNEAQIAKERAEKEAANRAAEIAKNIADLNKLNANAAKTAPAAVSAAKPASSAAPGVPIGAAAIPAPAAPASVPASAPPATASNPAASAPVQAPSTPAPAASKPAAPAMPAPVPMEEPGMLDDLLENPLVLPAGGALLALLGGFAFWRMRQSRKGRAQVDSSFLESRLQPDSFFGASGGQRVDTANDGPASASSMVYSASQLDAADDVDPVAEADVYLAYGRDLQAEEILKEAVRHNPARLAIHTKLMEIFAKRRDTQGYQTSAMAAYKITGADSLDWQRICEQGLTIDPDNKLYQPGGATQSTFASLEPAPASSGFGSTQPQSVSAELAEPAGAMDLDLDLDFSADEPAISDVTGGIASPPKAEQTVKMASASPGDMSLDFDVSGPAELAPAPASEPLPSISLSMDGLNLDAPPTAPAAPDFQSTNMMDSVAVTDEADKTPTGMMEFDMGSLSLDLDPPAADAANSESPSTTGEDPLETKLALAEEFISIGDDDGARALIEEVVAEATGEMRAKAQRALANLR